jgi:hypothetical protein
MRAWKLTHGDPLCLALSADFRFGDVNYADDHTWELDLLSAEPPGLMLRTTFGLRSRSMRLFPRFSEDRVTITDPADFSRMPRLRAFHPNLLELDFTPLKELDVTAEFRAAGSQVIAGRYTFFNSSATARKVRFDLCALLAPLDGQAFHPAQFQMIHVLAGATGGLAPLLYMTGSPAPSTASYPTLTAELNLAPSASQHITWALAALSTPEASFDLARRIVTRSWVAEKARIQVTAESQIVEIQTGDPDWDAAFEFTQETALRLVLPSTEHLPSPSFVLARGPDHGYSRQGDGGDYPLAWAGQSPLEAYYLASLLPGAPDLARGLLKNFLAVQKPDGFIDLRPGLAGQRSKILATPLLASLAWQIYQSTRDDTFLAGSFPGLLAFFRNWFSPGHDRDRDGLPEWDHFLQTGFEENPLFNVWDSRSQGVDISTVADPSLYAMLAREAGCLILMAEILGRTADADLIKRQTGLLDAAVASCWGEPSGLYQYRDLSTHLCLSGKLIAEVSGSATFKPKKKLETPTRLLIEVQTESPSGKPPEIRLAEYITKAPDEVIAPDQFAWRNGGFIATSRKVYGRLGLMDVSGLNVKDRVIVRSVDLTLQDHTLFLPLWAGLPEAQRAQGMLSRALLDQARFNKPFGIPACDPSPDQGADPVCSSVHLPWNQLIGEGLLAYGFQVEAGRLTGRLMAAVIQNLKQKHCFYQRYHADTGAGLGERNALTGLAPLGLFLQTLGVTILSPTKVRLEGRNPFPWPVTLRYRGLTVVRGMDSTEVTLPNGKSVTVTDPHPCEVSL